MLEAVKKVEVEAEAEEVEVEVMEEEEEEEKKREGWMAFLWPGKKEDKGTDKKDKGGASTSKK